MGLFGLGRKKPKPEAKVDPREDPNLIQVYDKYGRELHITKEKWRTDILPDALKSNWDKPEDLCNLIVQSIDDQFYQDVLPAAERLFQLDDSSATYACIYGFTLLKNEKLNEAERVFKTFMEKNGEEGAVLNNLAKVYHAQKLQSLSDATLWHSLEVDPNQDNALAWFLAQENERGGESAYRAALNRVAVLPRSWRAQLWQAREELKSKNLEKALALYQDILDRAVPASSDMLAQISGDLGQAGFIAEAIQLTEPRYELETHSIRVGNNLIKAHLDLGQIEEAGGILEKLYAVKRMDWKQMLDFWEMEIARARIAAVDKNLKTPMKFGLLAFEGPIWLKPTYPGVKLFPVRNPVGISIGFLGGTVESEKTGKTVNVQLTDSPGRMSRALPLLLAEQIYFNSQARVQTLMPWIGGDSPGFMLTGGPWKDSLAAEYAQKVALKSDYIATLHLNTQAEPWTLELRLVQAPEGKLLGRLEVAFELKKPEPAVLSLIQQFFGLLERETDFKRQSPPEIYEIPKGVNLSYYLLRLEQLLAVRCSMIDDIPPKFLSGVREMVDGNLQLCLDYPRNIGVRLLTAQLMTGLKKTRPDILPEFKAKFALLQKENPLPEAAQAVVNEMFKEVFGD